MATREAHGRAAQGLVRTSDETPPPTIADLEAAGGPSKQRLADWRTLKDAGEEAVKGVIKQALTGGLPDWEETWTRVRNDK